MPRTEPRPLHLSRFEVASRRELARTALGVGVFLKAAAPILGALAGSGRTRGPAVRVWSALLSRYLGMTVTLDGVALASLPSGPYIVAPLHEGLVDAVVLHRLGLDLTFMARDELFEWPELGPYLRASRQIVVPTDLDRAGLMAAVRQVRGSVDRGESVVVFPQGSILGIEIAFRRGAFALAERLSVPLLPVVITGSHLVWEHPYTDRLRFGCDVAMTVLPPVAPDEAMSRMPEIEREMKRTALDGARPPARRYVPERDGFWDGYRFEIDPAFPDVAAQIRAHRSRGPTTEG